MGKLAGCAHLGQVNMAKVHSLFYFSFISDALIWPMDQWVVHELPSGVLQGCPDL